MAFKHRYDGGWYKNAAGLYVQSEPVSAALTASAAAGDVVTRKSDGTLYFTTPASGGAAILYDSGALASPTNSLDTGAGGIAGGHDVLEIFMLLRTDEATNRSACLVRFNNDGTQNYRYQRLTALNTAVSANAISTPLLTGASVEAPGSNAAANVFGIARAVIPFYTETSANKVIEMAYGFADVSTAIQQADLRPCMWYNTAAITRLAVTAPATKNFVTGSHVIVYGR